MPLESSSVAMVDVWILEENVMDTMSAVMDLMKLIVVRIFPFLGCFVFSFTISHLFDAVIMYFYNFKKSECVLLLISLSSTAEWKQYGVV